jgi:hypothetical protein
MKNNCGLEAGEGELADSLEILYVSNVSLFCNRCLGLRTVGLEALYVGALIDQAGLWAALASRRKSRSLTACCLYEKRRSGVTSLHAGF